MLTCDKLAVYCFDRFEKRIVGRQNDEHVEPELGSRVVSISVTSTNGNQNIAIS